VIAKNVMLKNINNGKKKTGPHIYVGQPMQD
jgi:hypothetical protein